MKVKRPGLFWVGVFGIWIILLSGLPRSLTGTPGILQAFQLQNMLESRNQELSELEKKLVITKNQYELLRSNPWAQAREIRNVLGFTAKDELVFDFTPQNRSAVSKYR